jgi:hypothetical protein
MIYSADLESARSTGNYMQISFSVNLLIFPLHFAFLCPEILKNIEIISIINGDKRANHIMINALLSPPMAR